MILFKKNGFSSSIFISRWIIWLSPCSPTSTPSTRWRRDCPTPLLARMMTLYRYFDLWPFWMESFHLWPCKGKISNNFVNNDILSLTFEENNSNIVFFISLYFDLWSLKEITFKGYYQGHSQQTSEVQKVPIFRKIDLLENSWPLDPSLMALLVAMASAISDEMRRALSKIKRACG